MDTFLAHLEATCPGDDAHDGFGDPRPLLERCGACRETYEAHKKSLEAERDRCSGVADAYGMAAGNDSAGGVAHAISEAILRLK